MKKEEKKLKNYAVTIYVSDFVFHEEVEAYDETEAKQEAKKAAVMDVHKLAKGEKEFVLSHHTYVVDELIRKIKYSRPKVLSN